MLRGGVKALEITMTVPGAVAAWTALHGFVSLELFNHLQPLVGDPTDLFEAELAALIERMRYEARA